MGGAFSQCGSAGKTTTDPSANPQVEVAVTEIKACLEALRQKEESLEDLRAQLREKKGEGVPGKASTSTAGSTSSAGKASTPTSPGKASTSTPPKPRAIPDLAKKSLKQLQDLTAELEKELEELKTEEGLLRQQIFETSAYFKRARTKAAAASSLSRGSKASSNPSATPDTLTKEEQEFIADPDCLLNEDCDWGLLWDRRWQGQPMGPRDENMRRNRREGTKKKVTEVLGLWHFGETAWRAKKPQGGGVHLFLDRTPASTIGRAPAGDTFLLGRYDVVAVKVCADLDRNWNFIKGQKTDFWVAHAAALNIGESTKASDFPDFCRPENNPGNGGLGVLDEETYLEAMEHIMANVCQAVTRLHIEHLIFFPFGMGAFLRHLGQLDRRFTSYEDMQRLRRRLARSFMKVLAAATNERTRVHLCLMFVDEETQCNADALLRALAEPSDAVAVKLRKRVTVHPEGDCLQLAHELAQMSEKVMLVNGANRSLIGNHWFAGRAKLAIDENLHRRSWRMSSMAYLLNGFDGREPHGRKPEELLQNAQWLGAQIHTIDCIGSV